MLKAIPILPDWCIIESSFKPTYDEAKTYLGFKNAPEDVYVTLNFNLHDMAGIKNFFEWWKGQLEHGALPFFAKLPIYGDEEEYLIAQVGILTQSQVPFHSVSGKFMLFRNITRTGANPPVTENITVTVPEGSQNLVIPLLGTDPQTLPLVYHLPDGQTIIGDKAVVAGASLIYNAKRGNLATDEIWYFAYNGIQASAWAKVTINFIVRQSFYFRVQPTQDMFITSLGRKTTVKEDA